MLLRGMTCTYFPSLCVCAHAHTYWKNCFLATDHNHQSQQCFPRGNWARHQGVLFLLWWYWICWNAEVSIWISFFVFFLSSLCYMNFKFILCLCSKTEQSQIAFVTFKDSQGAETAVLLSVILLTKFNIIMVFQYEFRPCIHLFSLLISWLELWLCLVEFLEFIYFVVCGKIRN